MSLQIFQVRSLFECHICKLNALLIKSFEVTHFLYMGIGKIDSSNKNKFVLKKINVFLNLI